MPVDRSQGGKGREVLRWVLSSDVLFDFDESDLRPDAERELHAFLSELPQLGEGLELSIEGHTDAVGTNLYNHTLSMKRAESVAAWLSSNSPSLPRYTVKSFGEQRPAVPNTKPDGEDNPEGRQLNRRVEIVVHQNS